VKLTAKSEYALLALVYLARVEADGYITVKTIAKAQGIPPKFLEQLLLTLKRAKYLRSRKGQGGGYRLAKAADSISLAEIIRVFDGALAPTESVSEYFYAPTPVEKEKSLIRVFKQIRDYTAATLEQATIADAR